MDVLERRSPSGETGALPPCEVSQRAAGPAWPRCEANPALPVTAFQARSADILPALVFHLQNVILTSGNLMEGCAD